MRMKRLAALTRSRRYQDNGPVSFLGHHRRGAATTCKDRFEVYIDGFIPFPLGHRLNCSLLPNTGVGDEYIDGSEAIDGCAYHPVDFEDSRHVSSQDHCVCPKALAFSFDGLGRSTIPIVVDQQAVYAGFGKSDCCCRTDAARCPGDYRNSTIKIDHWCGMRWHLIANC